MTDRNPKFEVRRGLRRGRYRVVLIGANGEALSVSETLNSVDAVNTNVRAQLDALADVKHVQWPDDHRTVGGYSSSRRPAWSLRQPPTGPAPGH